MSDNDLVTLFASAPESPEPPLPAGFLDQTLTRARRSVRRRGLVGGLVIALAVAAAASLTAWRGWVPDRSGPATSGERPSLPAEFAAYSPLTASASAHPAGRAIALYDSGSGELFNTWQTLVAGADRDTYRTLPLGDSRGHTERLSPDGTSVLIHRDSAGTDQFTLLDLATGRSRVLHAVPWRSGIGAGVDMLAWSPDGRYVAYAVPASPPADGRTEGLFYDGRPIKHLAILDLASDSTVRYPQLGPVWGAAFAPEGRSLAVQLGHELWIVGTDGRRLRQLALPDGMDLVGGTAWSPDAALLAVTDGESLGFVDPTAAGLRVPEGQRVPDRLPLRDLLAWRDAGTVISTVDTTLTEVDIHTRQQRVLSRFSTPKRCEYRLQRCRAYRVQLATALIPQAGTRPSHPDRGPWPLRFQFVAIGLLVIGAAVAWRLFSRPRLVSRPRLPAR